MAASAATTTLVAIREAVLGWGWPPAVTLARKTVLGIFSQLEGGSLIFIDEPQNLEYSFGKKHVDRKADSRSTDSQLHVEITVKCDIFWLRLLLFADIGFAEGYMLGGFECNDLPSFFKLFIKNRKNLNDGMTAFSAISSILSRLSRSKNTLSNSLLNTVAHYDISNDMYAAFLSEDMTYSCPIWQHLGSSRSVCESLEAAQESKLLRFIEGAKLKASDHVLEIGTGWGSFAIQAVKRTGCRVTSITLSQKQKELAEKRIKLAGLRHRIEVKLMDYREIPVSEIKYDKIISIEMIEAVGQAHLPEYFARIHRLLKEDGGIAMFQCITIPEAQHTANVNKRDRFISQYIFPGGYLPSIMELLNHINIQSHGTLTLERVENIGSHYIKALRLWREKFLCQFDDKIKPSLLYTYPALSDESVGVSRRKWEYYFAYCEARFATKTLGDVIITVARAGTLELIEGIPL